MTETAYFLGEEPICLLYQAAARLSVEMMPVLKAHDLALPAWRIIAQLSLHGPMRVGCLADRLCLELSTVSRNIARLEERGLVARHRPEPELRASNLMVTKKGRRLVEEIKPSLADIQRPLRMALTATEQAQLRHILKRIPEILGDNAEEAAA